MHGRLRGERPPARRARDTARPRRSRHAAATAQDMETLRAELDWDAELTEVLKVLSTSEAAE